MSLKKNRLAGCSSPTLEATWPAQERFLVLLLGQR